MILSDFFHILISDTKYYNILTENCNNCFAQILKLCTIYITVYYENKQEHCHK